jgi:tetraacyldisaccharide 4'-kinase
MKDAAQNRVHRIWYEGDGWFRALLPLAGLYWLLIALRRLLYRLGIKRSRKAGVPVVVVGNITAGGTGKTPTTIWLAQAMRDRGFSPGIVSRGYGGSKSGASMRVDAESEPAVVGDEPVLIAMRAACPVVVDANRARAASMLVDDGVDLIIADDGLQHYALHRDYEICVVDGSRGIGNGLLLPAGPMRNAIEFQLVATEARRLNGSLTRPIDRFAGTTVHAVAAIGNPRRFFDLLRGHDIQVIEHAFADHATLDPGKLDFADDFDILMTEKDAVKFGRRVSDRFWYVPVDVEIDPVIAGPWLQQVESRMRETKGSL